MHAISTYRQPAYTDVDFTETIFGSLTGALPRMFLTISGITRIVSRKMEKSESEGLRAFPHWMYHVGEFNQYIDGAIKVIAFLKYIMLFSFESLLP
jgi:hypothetical protein